MLRDTSRSRFVLGALLAVCLVLLVLDSRPGDNPVTSAVRFAGTAVFSPVSAAVTTVAAPLSTAYRTALAAPGARAEIEELRTRNAELRGALRDRDRDEVRSAELDRLLTLSGRGGYEIVAAQAVTQLTPQGYADTITLDVGERDGVRPDMTVVNGDGLVGRVVRTGERSSTVLLLIDGASKVGARLEGSSEIGIVSGTSRSITESVPLRLALLDATAEIDKGERLVTLGSHGQAPFVPGVPIGTVTKVEETPGTLSRTAEVTPAVDVSALDIVGVVVAGPEEDPRDSVLPPGPGADAEKEAKDAVQGEQGAEPDEEQGGEPGGEQSAEPGGEQGEQSAEQDEQNGEQGAAADRGEPGGAESADETGPAARDEDEENR